MKGEVVHHFSQLLFPLSFPSTLTINRAETASAHDILFLNLLPCARNTSESLNNSLQWQKHGRAILVFIAMNCLASVVGLALYGFMVVVQTNASPAPWPDPATSTQKKPIPEPDPSFAVSVDLDGHTFINKVSCLQCQAMNFTSYMLLSGIDRVWTDSIKLCRVHWRHYGWNWEWHSSEIWNMGSSS